MNPILALLAAPLLVAGCSDGNGDAGEQGGIAAQGGGSARSWPVDGFTKVELAGSDDVEVRVGPAFSVRAQGTPEVLDRLRIDRDGDALEIGRRRGTSGPGKARILVTLPRLAAAALAGSGTMRVDRVEGGELKAELAGSGRLVLGRIAVEGFDVDIAGSGTLTAAGTARRIDVDVAGSGGLDAAGLTAAGAEVSVAGSGNVRARVDGEAEVEMLGSGNVDLGDGARCAVRKMGSGSVRCGR